MSTKIRVQKKGKTKVKQNMCDEDTQMKMPSAPPIYKAIDVVQEFSSRFEKRKHAIRAKFETKRMQLEKLHQKEIENLNKEEIAELTQLDISYAQWVTVEPPDYVVNTSRASPQHASGSHSKGTFQWLKRNLWG
jgi:hypothetical protein